MKSFGCGECCSPAKQGRHLFSSALILPVSWCCKGMALTCHLNPELGSLEKASFSSLDLADGLCRFCGGDRGEAAAEQSPEAGIGISFWGHQSCSSGIQNQRVASKSRHVPLKEAGSAEYGMMGQFIPGTEPACSDIISKSLIPFSVLGLCRASAAWLVLKA